ncbi:MAG: NAD-dependent epimerase/dehydratase family protein [Phycisphaeraceae bacterium]
MDCSLPETITSIEQLDDLLSLPTPSVVDALAKLDGDILVLGVAGKMGPTLARMAVRASEAAGVKRQVIGVARFSNPAEQAKLEAWGIKTIKADLLDERKLASLPEAPNLVYMAGMKFGSTGQEALTWAMNCYLPGRVCVRYASSRIVAFSTGNVYGLTPVTGGGSIETDVPNPQGDYATSCLGRERIFEHFGRSAKMPMATIRLNYATELRYGVLVDLARKIASGLPIDLAMGHCNVIWQGDANAMSLAAFAHAASPPFMLNVAGPELLSVRKVCEQLGRLMDKPVQFTGSEAPDALLNNGQLGHRLFGYPRVALGQLLAWVAAWVTSGGASLGKPTHFETRDGKF